MVSCGFCLYRFLCFWQVFDLPLTALDLFRDHARYRSLS